jgi:tetratricopeptide (TPR) repeat protein/energy-coupling factor transporter ATP-binding protein EcfA2
MSQSRCPYPGLRPFSAQDKDIFFGREEQVDALLRKLEEKRFVVVTGPSGCGKSSLVHAGMIPSLEEGFLLSAGENWKMVTFRPGESPVNNLAQSLSKTLHSEKNDSPENQAFVSAFLHRGPLGIVDLVKEAQLPENTRLLILVDQFEEIFRFHRQDTIEQATAFVNLLLSAVKHPDIYVCLTMRSDYIGDCALFMGLPEAMNDSQFLTPRLTRDQRRAVIVGPAAMFQGELEQGLVNELLNDMGADPDQLPLFQHALMRMWTICDTGTSKIRLTLAQYQKMGGIQHILSNHADDVYKGLNTKQQDIAQILFKTLVDTLSDKPDTRRPARVNETALIAKVDVNEVIRVIEKFRSTDCCFLMPSPEIPLNKTAFIDITHESLIRQWKQLKKWTQEEKNAAQIYLRLEEKACDWKNDLSELMHGRDLDNALDWKNKLHMGPEWAGRYGACFSDVLAYLEKSAQKQKQSQDNLIFLTSLFFNSWKKAEDAQSIAVKQKELALKAINTITYELVDQLKDIPGNIAVLTDILESNIEALDKIYELSPDDIQSLREKASNLNRIGDIWALLGNTKKTLESYEMALEIFKKIAESDATSAQAQRDLSVSYNKIGDVYLTLGRTEDALRSYEMDLEISKKIAESDATSAQAQRDLSVSYEKIGNVYLTLGRTEDALRSYEMALEISKKIAESDATSAQAQRDLSVSYTKLGSVYEKNQTQTQAIAYYEKGFPVALRLSKDYQNMQAQNQYNWIRDKLTHLLFENKNYPQCIQILNDIIANQEKPDASTWGTLSWYYLFSGQYDQALKAAQKGIEIQPNENWIYTNIIHAHLFLDQLDDARKIIKEKGNMLCNEKPLAEAVLDDFDIFETHGITHKNIAVIHQYIKEAINQ